MMKSLVLIRHGQRDIDPEDHDNGLNARGLVQARAVADFFARRHPGGLTGLSLRTSPKRRCLETLAPLATVAGRAFAVDPNLDERRPGESGSGLDGRVQNFLNACAQDPARVTIACSHGDWLPRAIGKLTGHQPDLPNACWFEVDWRGGPAELSWFIPTFEPFSTRS